MKKRVSNIWGVVGVLAMIGVWACGIEPKSQEPNNPSNPSTRPPAGTFPGVDEVSENLAQLASPCTFTSDAGLMTVNLAAGEYVLLGRAALADGGTGIAVNGTVCGAAAVANTQRINVTSPNDGGSETVIIDYLDGTFALPSSATAIGINIDLKNGTDTLRIRGSSGDDQFLFATSVADAGANSVYAVAVGINGTASNGRKAVQFTGVDSVVVSTGPGADSFKTGGQADAGLGGTPWGRVLSGSGPSLTLYGGDDADTLNGGSAKSGSPVTFHGGAGADVADYSGRTLAVTCSINGGAVCGESGEAATISVDVETFNGGSADDSITCSVDAGCTVAGNGGADSITGSEAADTLNGGAGNDTIIGGLGNDTIVCGGDTDTVSYSDRSGAVSVTLGAGGASSTSNGALLADGGVGETDDISACENVIGGSAGDTIVGNEFDNVITGGAGNDTLSGGSGNDTFAGDSSTDGNDSINGQGGTDTVSYATRTNALTVVMSPDGGVGGSGESGETDSIQAIENLICGGGNDNVTGNSDNNLVEGGDGDDTIDTGAGDDIIDPGAGTNGVTCGAGNDLLLPGGTTTNTAADCEG